MITIKMVHILLQFVLKIDYVYMVIQHDKMIQGSSPTISTYIQRFKTFTTRLYIEGVKEGNYPQFDKKIWQKSFYDHVIRNEEDYQSIWQYIDTNPLKWHEDKYYK